LSLTLTLAWILRYASEMSWWNAHTRKPTWQVTAENKRNANLAKIPPHWCLDDSILKEARQRSSIVGDFLEELLDEQTRRITSLDASDLVEMMRNSSLTAVETVNAFSKRAAYVRQLGCCGPVSQTKPSHDHMLMTETAQDPQHVGDWL